MKALILEIQPYIFCCQLHFVYRSSISNKNLFLSNSRFLFTWFLARKKLAKHQRFTQYVFIERPNCYLSEKDQITVLDLDEKLTWHF